jgi:hypothetical protein
MEEPDTKIEKKGKNQNRVFRPSWGRQCWLALSLFFFFKNTATYV